MKTKKALIVTALGLLACQAANASDLFASSERNLLVFGSYVDKDDSDLAPGVGLSYFLTRNLGIIASTYWENTDGSFIDNVTGEAVYRVPLRALALAPYGLVGIGYSFETEETFEHFGAGAEFRFSRNLGVFGDVRWQFNDDTDDGPGIRFGIRLSL
ncbi:MAG TPA: porin family protein [Verrucomicrobia bacterium]|nr:porin family protein [Verrucomicrobiota bacterium]HOB32203.1 outer membrane beta-barrel protein [Verrucomicrobiota bacterium]HOP97019.1 outer membrane beta-barrel protein [Verrucomicrobiota bacterium]HPU55380.1 outer membrane beta-barrel protein [Verrucomicrobiota bacterium]